MLKYILGFLAGAVGLFLGVLIAVLLAPKAGGLQVAFGAGCAIGAARLGYGYFRDKERIKETGTTEAPALLKSDVANFQKAFLKIDRSAMTITEVKILERDDQVSFYVGIRSTDSSKIDYDAIRRELKKVYYGHIEFEFLEFGSGKAQFLDGTGVVIPN